MKKLISWIIYHKWILLILLLAVGLRFYKLGIYPIGTFSDELDAGYNAYSFWLTGRDYNGNWMPIHFESMGDFRPFGFILGLVPSVAIFGLSDFSIRLVPAIWGVLGVFLIYLLLNELGYKRWGLISSFFLAIIPWHIHYSRAAFEVTMMSSLILLGIWSLLKARKNSNWLWLAIFSFGYATYTYNVAKLFSPWLFGLTVLIFRKDYWKNKIIFVLSLVVFLVCLSPLVYDSILGPGQNRFNSLSILNDQKIVDQVNYARGQIAPESMGWQKIFQNRYLGAGKTFLDNYLKALDPSFIFFEGQADNPRHGVTGHGLLYWWMLPLFVWGLFYLFKDFGRLFNRWILFFLITAPIPAALTIDGGHHATRLFLMIFPLVLLAAKGLDELLKYFSRFEKLVWVFVFILTGVSMSMYLQDYYVHYPQNHYRDWQYGMEDAVKYALKKENSFDQIIVTKNYINFPMLFYVFYSEYDPAKLQEQFMQSKNGSAPPPSSEIGKYRFMSFSKGDETRPKNALYINAVPNDETIGWAELGSIESPDLNDDKPILLLLRSD